MEFTTPPSYGSTVVSVGGIIKGDQIIYAGSSNKATHTKFKEDPENAWPEPEAVKFEWTGTTKDGKAVEAVLEGPLETRLDRIDIMAEVPYFVKMIIASAAGTKPYIYQVCILIHPALFSPYFLPLVSFPISIVLSSTPPQSILTCNSTTQPKPLRRSNSRSATRKSAKRACSSARRRSSPIKFR